MVRSSQAGVVTMSETQVEHLVDDTCGSVASPAMIARLAVALSAPSTDVAHFLTLLAT